MFWGSLILWSALLCSALEMLLVEQSEARDKNSQLHWLGDNSQGYLRDCLRDSEVRV